MLRWFSPKIYHFVAPPPRWFSRSKEGHPLSSRPPLPPLWPRAASLPNPKPVAEGTRQKTKKLLAAEEPIPKRTRQQTNFGTRIVTWNMEGQSSSSTDTGGKITRLRKFLGNQSIRAICLQECGNPDTLPKEDGWTLISAEWSATDGGNTRCSLATYIRGMTAAQSQHEAIRDRHRPILGVTISCKGTLIDIWNIHAPSARNTNTAALVEDTIKIAMRNKRPFMIVGDYNQPPTTTLQGPIAQQGGVEVVAPQQATRPSSGHTSDYFSYAPGLMMSGPTIVAFDSDHTSVEAEFWIASRSDHKEDE